MESIETQALEAVMDGRIEDAKQHLLRLLPGEARALAAHADDLCGLAEIRANKGPREAAD